MTATIATAVAAASALHGRLLAEAAAPFVEAAVYVLDHQCHQAATRGKLDTLRTTVTPDEVNIVVAVVGNDVAGIVMYTTSGETASRLASTMLGEAVDEPGALALSAIGELANMTTGQATTRLQRNGFATVPTPPELILGAGRFLNATPVTFLTVPLDTAAGVWTVQLALHQRGQAEPETAAGNAPRY